MLVFSKLRCRIHLFIYSSSHRYKREMTTGESDVCHPSWAAAPRWWCSAGRDWSCPTNTTPTTTAVSEIRRWLQLTAPLLKWKGGTDACHWRRLPSLWLSCSYKKKYLACHLLPVCFVGILRLSGWERIKMLFSCIGKRLRWRAVCYESVVEKDSPRPRKWKTSHQRLLLTKVRNEKSSQKNAAKGWFF